MLYINRINSGIHPRGNGVTVVSNQAELLRRAVECEGLMDLASAPKMKKLLKQVRETWIALADESPNLSSTALGACITGIEGMQSALEHFLLEGRCGSSRES